jgi:hypothetical protein
MAALNLFIIFPWLVARKDFGRDLTFNNVFWLSFFWLPYWMICIVVIMLYMIIMPQDTILSSPYYWMKEKYEKMIIKFKDKDN